MSRHTGGKESIRATRDHGGNSNDSSSSEIGSRNGEWEGWVSFGHDPVSGKRLRRKVRGATKADVQAKIDVLRQQPRRTPAGQSQTGGAQTGEALS